jgi:putative oxidoreductase
MFEQKYDFRSALGLLVLRVVVGGLMMTHGWGKVQMLVEGRAAEFGDPIGLGNQLSLVCAAGAEFGCALLVTLGCWARLAALPVVFTMLVAAFKVHADDPWTMGQGASKEPALLFMAVFAAIALSGPGPYSLDAHLEKRRGEQKAKEASKV